MAAAGQAPALQAVPAGASRSATPAAVAGAGGDARREKPEANPRGVPTGAPS
jgi:hypothetical protein